MPLNLCSSMHRGTHAPPWCDTSRSRADERDERKHRARPLRRSPEGTHGGLDQSALASESGVERTVISRMIAGNGKATHEAEAQQEVTVDIEEVVQFVDLYQLIEVARETIKIA